MRKIKNAERERRMKVERETAGDKGWRERRMKGGGREREEEGE